MASLSATAGWAADKIVPSSFNENQLISSLAGGGKKRKEKGVELIWSIMTQALHGFPRVTWWEGTSALFFPLVAADARFSQGKIGGFIDARRDFRNRSHPLKTGPAAFVGEQKRDERARVGEQRRTGKKKKKKR